MNLLKKALKVSRVLRRRTGDHNFRAKVVTTFPTIRCHKELSPVMGIHLALSEFISQESYIGSISNIDNISILLT